MSEIRVLSATGVLGSGFREETLKRAMALGPAFIGADSGSTDPGPYYLGSGENLFSDSACKRDLRLMLLAGRAAKIPVIVRAAGAGGADDNRDLRCPAARTRSSSGWRESRARSRGRKNCRSSSPPSPASRTRATSRRSCNKGKSRRSPMRPPSTKR